MHNDPAFRKLFPGETHDSPYLSPMDRVPEPIIGPLPPLHVWVFGGVFVCLFAFAVYCYAAQVTTGRAPLVDGVPAHMIRK